MSQQFRESMPIRVPIFLRGYGESKPDDNIFKMFPSMVSSQPAFSLKKFDREGADGAYEAIFRDYSFTPGSPFTDNRPNGGSLRSPIMQLCPTKNVKHVSKTAEWEAIPIEAIDDVIDQFPTPDHDIGYFSETETVPAEEDFDTTLPVSSSMPKFNLGDRKGCNRHFRPPKTATYVPVKDRKALELRLAINIKYNCVLSDDVYGDVMISKDGGMYVQHGKEVYKLKINPKNWFTWGQRQFGCNQFQGYRMDEEFVPNYGYGPVKKAKHMHEV